MLQLPFVTCSATTLSHRQFRRQSVDKTSLMKASTTFSEAATTVSTSSCSCGSVVREERNFAYNIHMTEEKKVSPENGSVAREVMDAPDARDGTAVRNCGQCEEAFVQRLQAHQTELCMENEQLEQENAMLLARLTYVEYSPGFAQQATAMHYENAALSVAIMEAIGDPDVLHQIAARIPGPSAASGLQTRGCDHGNSKC